MRYMTAMKRSALFFLLLLLGAVSCTSNDGGSTEGETTVAETTVADTVTGPCRATSECGSDEVCMNGECVGVWSLDYEVRVTKFSPPDCALAFTEAVYKIWLDKELAHASTDSECPGDWHDESFVYSPTQSFELEFFEVEGAEENWLTALCWLNTSGCGALPTEVLHDLKFVGQTADGLHEIEIELSPMSR